jgi:hypothetical protein
VAESSGELDVEALRSVLRLTMTQLVSELGQVGGPCVPRVDLLFRLLTGPERSSDAAAVGAVLGRFRERLGLGVGSVNTVEDEEQLTNFRMLADHVQGLRSAWESTRSSFDRRSASFEGGRAQLLLSRLGTVQGAAERMATVLEDAGVGRARRDEILIELEDGSSLSITEYLDWVRSFASREGPRLIRAGGDEGISVIALTAGRLHEIATRSPLRTLLEVIAAEVAELEKALDQLYEDAFIDTDEPPDGRNGDSDNDPDGKG